MTHYGIWKSYATILTFGIFFSLTFILSLILLGCVWRRDIGGDMIIFSYHVFGVKLDRIKLSYHVFDGNQYMIYLSYSMFGTKFDRILWEDKLNPFEPYII